MVNITKNFIKQCEYAEEIQKLCQYKMGDWFNVLRKKRSAGDFNDCWDIFVLDDDDFNFKNHIKLMEDNITKWVWLPTQEQLFEIILKWCQTDKIVHHLLVGESINLYILKEMYYYANSFDGIIFINNIKALTLSYIYKNVYHKVWTGKKWVLINEKNNL